MDGPASARRSPAVPADPDLFSRVRGSLARDDRDHENVGVMQERSGTLHVRASRPPARRLARRRRAVASRAVLRVLAVPAAVLAATAALACPAPAHAVRVTTVATGLEIPWEIAFLPGGNALVTERPGRVRLLTRNGRLRRAPVARVRVSAQGEGGLLGLALDPAFARNRFVYLYFTTRTGMRLERRRLTGGRLVRVASLVSGIAAGPIHDSGRIAFGPDRRLYASTGDAGRPELAQDPSSLNGKFLAFSPAQYRGSGPARPAIVSLGHRNAQGFDWEPGSGRMVATEHGPTGFDGEQGWDEVNEIVQGGNYGWPRVYGPDQRPFVAPLRLYREAIAPSGATFATRGRWKGDFIFACLRGEQLRRLTLRDGRVVADRPLLVGRYGRLRTVVEAPGSSLYVLTSNRDGRGTPAAADDRILRVEP
jgi:glucose/arabinose dehydrogenase